MVTHAADLGVRRLYAAFFNYTAVAGTTALQGGSKLPHLKNSFVTGKGNCDALH